MRQHFRLDEISQRLDDLNQLKRPLPSYKRLQDDCGEPLSMIHNFMKRWNDDHPVPEMTEYLPIKMLSVSEKEKLLLDIYAPLWPIILNEIENYRRIIDERLRVTQESLEDVINENRSLREDNLALKDRFDFQRSESSKHTQKLVNEFKAQTQKDALVRQSLEEKIRALEAQINKLTNNLVDCSSNTD